MDSGSMACSLSAKMLPRLLEDGVKKLYIDTFRDNFDWVRWVKNKASRSV